MQRELDCTQMFSSPFCLIFRVCLCYFSVLPLILVLNIMNRFRITISRHHFCYGQVEEGRQCAFLVFVCYVNRDFRWQYETGREGS